MPSKSFDLTDSGNNSFLQWIKQKNWSHSNIRVEVNVFYIETRFNFSCRFTYALFDLCRSYYVLYKLNWTAMKCKISPHKLDGVKPIHIWPAKTAETEEKKWFKYKVYAWTSVAHVAHSHTVSVSNSSINSRSR